MSLVVEFGNGRALTLGDVSAPDRPGSVSLLTDGQMWVSFGGCNVVHVAVA